MRANYPTKAELEGVFELIDGELWRKAFVDKTGRRREPKLVVNTANCVDGYCQVGFKERMVKYHTIVYILLCGDIPEGSVADHINGNRLDNNINNLRVVSPRANSQNYHSHRKGRLVGCTFDRGSMKWRAQIKINKKRVNLGRYNTECEAHDVYMNAFDLIEAYDGDSVKFRELIGA